MTLAEYREALLDALAQIFPQAKVTLSESRGLVLTCRAELAEDAYIAVYFNALTGKTGYALVHHGSAWPAVITTASGTAIRPVLRTSTSHATRRSLGNCYRNSPASGSRAEREVGSDHSPSLAASWPSYSTRISPAT